MMTTWNAFSSLDRVLDEAVRSALRGSRDESAFAIAADVREKDDEYTFQLDVPGVKLEDLEITLANQVLTIRGERRFAAGQDERVTRGRPHGPFVASYALRDSIDGDALTAELAEGVLTIRVPKEPKPQPRKIPIGLGAEPKHLSE